MEKQMFLEDYQETFQFQQINEAETEGGYFIRGIVSRAGAANKNRRVYPIPVMAKAISSLQEKIAKGGFVGELDHPCLIDKNFDVLTKAGWKKFVDLKLEEDVISFDENNIMVENKIETIINEPFEGKVYHFKGRNIDSTFTGAHRFYLEDRNGKREIATAKEIYEGNFSHHKIIKIGKWSADTADTFTIKGIPEENYTLKFKEDVRKDLVMDTKAFMAMIGFFLSEGCTRKDDYRVMFSQNEGLIADEFREVLKQLPFEVKEYKRVNRDNVNINFVITDIRLHNYLKPIGDCYTKYIPIELKNMDSPYLEELLDWYIKGDGRDQRAYKGSNRRNLFSVSKRLVEDLHEILIKTGGSGNWTEIKPENDYMFADHLIEVANKQVLYQLNISTTKGIYLDKRFLSITEDDYKGNIYCITVPAGNFYMKQNGKSFLTGNSSPKINVNKISHKITKLEMMPDGAVIAEMVVLDTTEGLELQNLIRGGVHLGVSTRALGGVKPYHGELGEGLVEVLPGLNFKAIDVVFDPSAGEDGRPDFVNEDVINEDVQEEKKVFSSVWGDMFNSI